MAGQPVQKISDLVFTDRNLFFKRKSESQRELAPKILGCLLYGLMIDEKLPVDPEEIIRRDFFNSFHSLVYGICFMVKSDKTGNFVVNIKHGNIFKPNRYYFILLIYQNRGFFLFPFVFN